MLIADSRASRSPLSQIGKQVGGLDYAAVGMAIRRFEFCCRREKKLFRIREKLKMDLMA